MRLMLIRAATLDYEKRPVYQKSASFDDLTLAQLAANTPSEVETRVVVEAIDGVDFDVDVDVVGVTAMGVSPMLRSYQIAREFRRRGVRVILGGPNFTLRPEEAKQHADSVVLGETDEVWRQVLEDARRRELKPFYASHDTPDISALPVPRYDFFNTRPEFRNAFFTVQASRGCPHRCDFCAIGTLYGGRIRFRPLDDVIRDVEATGSKRIFFADDDLMANRKYYMELFERLIPLKVHWVGASTSLIGDQPEMLRLARKSGALLLIVGLESVNQANLDGVHKKFNQVPRYKKVVKAIHDAGIVAATTTIFGFDGDDPGVFDRTVDFYREAGVKVSPFFVLTPVPGTTLWKRMKEQGRILTEDYSHYDAVRAVFKPAMMTPSELEQGLLHAYRKMYGIGSVVKRLLVPPLFNPMADGLAAYMNLKYLRLNLLGGHTVFNFG